MKRIWILSALMLMLSGCIGTVVGTAVDITTEVIKVPFKVGGAIADAVSSDEEEADDKGKD